MRIAFPSVALAALGNFSPLSSQPRVDPRNSYERVIAVVPMTGSGKASDARRPMYAPAPAKPGVKASRAEILGYACIPSDDLQHAICEFVEQGRAALQPLIADSLLAGKVFEKGKTKRADLEQELRKYRKNFDLDKFPGVTLQ